MTRHIQATSTGQTRVITMLAVITAACLLFAANAMAITVPESGGFLYDLYDIAIVQILQGPGGYVGGAAIMVVACVLLVRQMILPGVCAMLGGALMIRADSIVQSLGAVVC